MTLTDRDRKIAMVLVPLVLAVGYWFFVLGPKRDEAAKLGATLSEAEGKRDAANAQVGQLEGSKNSYAKDYETVVRLGKAIPAKLDMPSLLVQLEVASKGTGIRFSKVRAGDRNAAPAAPAPPASGQGGDAAAGGEKASTGAGNATEQANEAAQTSDSENAAAGADPATASSGTPAAGSTAAKPGLDSVPLEFTFSGSFFDLADFFHRMKRFVRVANKDIRVQGRLMTIDRLTFKSDQFPVITAEVTSTVYLSPKSEGATAGATPQGPATDGATPAATQAADPAPPASSPVAQSGESAR
jgi:Tfp pilus assembly protein PilO